MARLILILLFSLTLAFAHQLEVQDVAEKLLRTTGLILPTSDSITLFWNERISASSRAILDRFLRITPIPVVITSRLTFADPSETKCSVVFVDQMDFTARRVLDSKQRKVIVIAEYSFPAVLKNCIYGVCKNFVYLVHGEKNCSIYHYNQFFKVLRNWEELEVDPTSEATKDLAGHSFFSDFARISDNNFVMNFAQKFNGTHVWQNRGNFMISSIETPMLRQYFKTYQTFYMHRTETNNVLVPRINKPISMMYNLTDPFTPTLWLLILATIFALATFRTFLAQRLSIQLLIRHFVNLIGSISIGTSVEPFNRNLEQPLLGLFLLLYVVLINCYQSLVISFILSPRFYPELDTLPLLNESCCWTPHPVIESFNFKQFGKCDFALSSKLELGIDAQAVLQARNLSMCVPTDSWWKEIIDGKKYGLSLKWELFRWSRVTLNGWPMMALLEGDSVIAERVERLSGLYFGEGALFARFAAGEEDGVGSEDLKSFALVDLEFMWLVYGFGMGFAGVVVLVERVISGIRNSVFIDDV